MSNDENILLHIASREYGCERHEKWGKKWRQITFYDLNYPEY
jgi:hypothetical protein